MHLEDHGKEIIALKTKNNKIVLEFKDEKIKLLKNTAVHFGFKVGDVITSSLMTEILSLDKKNEIFEFAKDLLSREPISEKDLAQRINKKFCYPKQLKAVLIELKKLNIFNEKEYLNNYIEYFNKNYYGKYFILNYFRSQNVKQSVLNELVFDEQKEIEKAAAYFELIKNKFVSSSFAKQKRKIYDNMLERGFAVDVIFTVISSLQIDVEKEKKQLIKEYKKVKYKYMTKANEGIDSTNKIVNKLVDKGYSLQLISDVIMLDKEGKIND